MNMAGRTTEAPRRRQQHDGRIPEQPVTPISSMYDTRSPGRRRLLRTARRLVAVGAFTLAAFLAYSFVAAPLLEPAEEEGAAIADEAVEGAAAEPALEDDPLPRPESAPQRIPEWAWALNEWHSTPPDERSERPAEAPLPVPDWYWEWRAWRTELTLGSA